MSDPLCSCVFSLSAELERLAEVREAVASLLDEREWPVEARDRMMLAGGEALINAIEHGSQPDGVVDVRIEVNGETARFIVSDGGREGSSLPMLNGDVPPPDSVRGRGLIIMRGLSDRAEIRASGAGTEVVLEFFREPEA